MDIVLELGLFPQEIIARSENVGSCSHRQRALKKSPDNQDLEQSHATHESARIRRVCFTIMSDTTSQFAHEMRLCKVLAMQSGAAEQHNLAYPPVLSRSGNCFV